MYVCMHARMYVGVYRHTPTHTCVYIYICIYMHVYIYIHIHIHIYVCVYIYIYTYVLLPRHATFGREARDFEFGFWDSRFRVEGLGFRVEGSGFRSSGMRSLEFRVLEVRLVRKPYSFRLGRVEWNQWTQAENFLLIEKLSTSTEEEEWAEIAAQCDSSPTYETEAFQVKARRKYAAAKGVSFDSVTVKEVENRRQSKNRAYNLKPLNRKP